MIRIATASLYVPVCLYVYWRLLPRLSLTAKSLAVIMLAAQILVLGSATVFHPADNYANWVLNLDQEWNIPSALASTQLALVGVVALLTCWQANVKSAWQRLYLFGIGLIFLFLSFDEYARIHEFVRNWPNIYAALGAAIVATTLVYAAHQPRRARIWDFCFIAGLAISATGFLVLDQLYVYTCPDIVWEATPRCPLYYTEESLEFLGIWLALLGMLGRFSDVAPKPRSLVRGIIFCIPVIWFLTLIPTTLVPYLAIQFTFQPISIEYETHEMQAFRLDYSDRAVDLQFLAKPTSWQNYSGLGYSLHLVDQVSGLSVAGVDESASRQDPLSFRRQYPYPWVTVHLYNQSMELEIPPEAPTNRALWVVLTAWRERSDGFARQNIISSDYQLLDETQVVLDELVFTAQSAAASLRPVATFENGFSLQAVDVPAHAQAGETLTIPFAWRSSRNGQEDLTQFLHFVHKESGFPWGHDQFPLGDRLPTRLWYSGLADAEVWEVPLPADLAQGQYEVFTGLYRSSDLERLPAKDADGELWLDGRVSLGSLTIEDG